MSGSRLYRPSLQQAGHCPVGALFSQGDCLRAGVSYVAEAKAVIMLAWLLQVEASSTTDGRANEGHLEAGFAQQGTPGSSATRSPTLRPLTSSPMSTTVLHACSCVRVQAAVKLPLCMPIRPYTGIKRHHLVCNSHADAISKWLQQIAAMHSSVLVNTLTQTFRAAEEDRRLPGGLMPNNHRLRQHKVSNATLQAKTAFSPLMRHAHRHFCCCLTSSPPAPILASAPILKLHPL